MPDYDPSKSIIDKHSHADSNQTQAGAQCNTDTSPVGVDDKGCREGKYRVHECEQEPTQVNNHRGLIIDGAEIGSDGIESVEEDGDGELP